MSDTTAEPGSGRLSRRELLRRIGVGSAALTLGPAFLAACGGDDDDAAPAGSTAAGETGGSAGSGGDAAKIGEWLKIDPANAGKGKSYSIGAVLALTGSGSFYGKTMSRGIDLAVEHIKAAGGPDFKIEYFDHKSGDAAAGKEAITALGSKKVSMKLASYADDLGAMLEGTEQYKIFTLDGGGGTSIFAQNKPYFWGTRAITPNDPLPGLFKWLKETQPNAKTVGLCGWDIGEPGNGIIKADILKKITDGGFTHNGLYELVPVGTQDYAQVFPKLKANEPDVLLVSVYGQDPGAFVNQSVTAGLKAFVVGFEFTPDGVNASKGAYDKEGWLFTYDYFDPATAASPLAKLFVADFNKKYGEDPDFYAANFYENTLNLWEIVARVLKKGGDPASGEALNTALQENLTLYSVYGGDETTVGQYALDPKTHSVTKRPMGIFEYKDGKVTPKAFFGLNAEGYRKV